MCKRVFIVYNSITNPQEKENGKLKGTYLEWELEL